MVRCCKWWILGIPPTWLVICGVIMVQVGYGLYPVLVKKFARTADPLVFSFYRDLGCFPLLFLCAFAVERKIMIPGLKMLLIFMCLGMTGMFGSQLLYIFGVSWAGPDRASAFQPAIPVWTTILALLSCTEKLPSPFHVHSWVKLIGILMATGGAIELVLTGNNFTPQVAINSTANSSSSSSSSHAINQQMLGYIALTGNTFCTAVYLLIQKRYIFNNPANKWREYPIYVTAYSYFFGALFMGLASIYYAASRKFDKFTIEQISAYALVYAICITSATCYLLVTWSNMHMSPTVITAFWPLQVLVTVLAAYFVVGDELDPLQYIGAVMLILALFLVLFSNHMEGRLQEGKTVLRVDCHLVKASAHLTVQAEDDEIRPLLSTGGLGSVCATAH